MNLQQIFAGLSATVALAFAAGAAEVGVSELDLGKVATGWGKVGVGQSAAGVPMRIGGESFAKGIGVHAPSQADILLDGRAKRFHAMVGVNQGGGNEQGSVEFLVTGDGRKLFSSGIVRGGDKPMPVDVPLKGVRKLRLVVTDGGDNVNSDHANWADAVISYSGARPAMMAAGEEPGFEPQSLYPPIQKLVRSPGGKTWFVNPATGDDKASGGSPANAWKSVSRINGILLGPGDHVRIAPGVHDASLKPAAIGSARNPVVIEFLPGTHEFPAEQALARPWFISNSCDAPKWPKPVGILIEDAKHLVLRGVAEKSGRKPLVLMGGRMVHCINHRSEDVSYQNLVFDLKRPTVSEFRVREVEANHAVIEIAEGSSYEVVGGKFQWTGDWGTGGPLYQLADPESGRCWRGGSDPFSSAKATDLGARRVRLDYPSGNGGLVKGRQHHIRLGRRDTVGAHNNRSKDISFIDCEFNALANMGIVSQFVENLTFRNVHVIPPAGTIRTCPGWADAFHFSGCKGLITIDSCSFSGLQDDPVNIHGTHLRIVGKPAENQLRLRFMHPQTYGFAAFAPGDEVAVISHTNLRELPGNSRRKVTAIVPIPGDSDGKEWLLTLDGPAPAFGDNDVIDNISWYPDVVIRNTLATMIPTRGFLLTTRGRVLVEGNTFHRCAMPGILIEDDANGWFESGPVRDMIIRNNRFIDCGIEISPKTSSNNPEEPVHENIRIENNVFDGGGIHVRNTQGLVVTGNRSKSGRIPMHFHPSCGVVKQDENSGKATD